MRDQYQKAFEKVSSWFGSLSGRERLLVGLAGLILPGMVIYSVVDSALAAFQEQSERHAKLERDIRTVTNQLNQYQRLKMHKESIENRYEKIQIQQGVRAHLDSLIRKFTSSDSPQVRTGTTSPFGSFEQTKVSASFKADNLEGVIKLLKELAHGNQPVILSRVEIKKDYRGTALEVELDISSIRKS